MYLLENPVLQRELLVNLRTARAFVLLFGYNALLGLVVMLAWPQEEQLDLSRTRRRPAFWSICSSWASTCWRR